MFLNPDVSDTTGVSLKWNKPDEEGLIQFLCTESEFSIDRVRKGIERLNKARKQGSQKRLDSFFKVVARPKKKKPVKVKGKGTKRKNNATAKKKGKRQKKN